MGDSKATGAADSQWIKGRLHIIDSIPHGDAKVGHAISVYAEEINTNRNSRHWVRAVQWVENFLFSLGRHYVDDVLVSRLTRDSSSGQQSVVQETADNIPKPVNDLLGRYVETNIALLTENKPIPRISSKSGRAEDEDAAQLSELTMEYMWEALDLPEKHREIARIILHCGVCWMEVIYDETCVRRMTVPETETSETSTMQGVGAGQIQLPLPRETEIHDERGRPIYTDKVEYGDITATIVSPFEMHLPQVHWWDGDDMGWVMREYYTDMDLLEDRFRAPGLKLLKKDGWFLDRLKKAQTTNTRNLPIWWWERIADMVEGSGPSLYVGTPETWDGYTTVRIFDRKPNAKWPRGRTVITAGDQVIYDSPKKRGARAYDPRWPKRWHPYVRYRWEAMPGSINGRSLVSKLLPKLKRVNAIDTTMIMWRRTVPMSAWVIPKGAQPIEDQWLGRPGQIWEYDPRRTAGAAPEPIYPPPYPAAAEQERQQQITEMEAIAGTEEILRGQRPTGVNSAAMIDILRKQALAGRSSILQEWDEALQKEGSVILQEVIKHIRDDDRYAERLRILARDKSSTLAIRSFSGADLTDNVIVHIDTASMALSSKEAKQAKAIELIQYASNLQGMPPALQARILEEMGYEDALIPQGADVARAKRIMAWVRQEAYQMIVPMPEDDPFILYGMFVEEMKSDGFHNLNEQQQMVLLALVDLYKQMSEQRQQEMMQMQMMQAQMQQAGGGGQGGGGQ
jgi:hypothetical protein